jgi:uracil-DNA glycosylase
MIWEEIIKEEQQKLYYKNMIDLIKTDMETYTIFPEKKDVFNAFKQCSYDNTKVLILGMDPYHGPGQAHGLSFSVLPGVEIPPSLRNIFKEIKEDLNIESPNHGCLMNWSRNGVLLLNSALTVRQGEPGSHQKLGWQIFTDRIISSLNEKETPIVFLLWGAFARKKKILIDNQNHLILEAAHPSPLSAHNGFFGCKHFSQTNEFLKNNNLKEIDWGL